MNLRLPIDMKLSPEETAGFTLRGWDALHWSEIGDPTASDATVMAWASANLYVVFTHDLDFGALLAHTGAAI